MSGLLPPSGPSSVVHRYLLPPTPMQSGALPAPSDVATLNEAQGPGADLNEAHGSGADAAAESGSPTKRDPALDERRAFEDAAARERVLSRVVVADPEREDNEWEDFGSLTVDEPAGSASGEQQPERHVTSGAVTAPLPGVNKEESRPTVTRTGPL